MNNETNLASQPRKKFFFPAKKKDTGSAQQSVQENRPSVSHKQGVKKTIVVKKHSGESGKQSEVAQEIIKKLNCLSYTCMICIDVVKRRDDLWHCRSCFKVYHLSCTKKWQMSSLSDEDSSWSCPHCRALQRDIPKFYCYCRKVVRPQFNAFGVVGSCNAPCGKYREGTTCPHPVNYHPPLPLFFFFEANIIFKSVTRFVIQGLVCLAREQVQKRLASVGSFHM